MSIVWVDEDKAFNIGIKSVLDGKPMDGISSLRIHSGPDMTQVIDLTIIYIMYNQRIMYNVSCIINDHYKIYFRIGV